MNKQKKMEMKEKEKDAVIWVKCESCGEEFVSTRLSKKRCPDCGGILEEVKLEGSE